MSKYGINVYGHGNIGVERVDSEGFWGRYRFETVEEARKFIEDTEFELSHWTIFDAVSWEIIDRMDGWTQCGEASISRTKI